MVRVNHIGRLGEYVELAAAQDVISVLLAGGLGVEVPTAVPYGGSRPVLHTNPIAMGFPAGQETPVILDIATTALSGVKVDMAREKNRPLPPGSIVDRDGNPTTDPAAFFEGGAFLPFGGHKGYGLMLAAEFLGRILTGADAFAAKPWGAKIFSHSGATIVAIRADLFGSLDQFGGHKGYGLMLAAEFLGRILTGADAFAAKPWGAKIFSHSGATIVAIRADLFGSLDQYSKYAEEMGRKIRAVPPAPGFREVLVPGDPKARTRQTRLRDGIPIPQQGTTVSIKRQEAGAAFRSCMERRYCERLRLAQPLGIRLQRIGHDETERTLLRGLSLDGSSFLVDYDWDIGTEVDVEIEAPTGSDSPTSVLHLRGTAARSEKVKGKTRIGVSFRARPPIRE